MSESEKGILSRFAANNLVYVLAAALQYVRDYNSSVSEDEIALHEPNIRYLEAELSSLGLNTEGASYTGIQSAILDVRGVLDDLARRDF